MRKKRNIQGLLIAEDSIKMASKEGEDWINLAKDTDWRWAIVKTLSAGNILTD
jgi:hypothetical protein